MIPGVPLIRRILRHKIPEGQLLRSRWVLTWKPLDEVEQAETGLEKKYHFGSQRHSAFTFTGVQLQHEANGDILLSQQNYVNDIAPINISDVSKTPGLPVTSQELQDLRGLIGSIQYAGTNTRPDLSCRLSLLQARVTCATVAGLTQRNKVAE